MLDSGLCAVQLAEDCRFSGAIARAAELFCAYPARNGFLDCLSVRPPRRLRKGGARVQKKDAALAAPFAQEGMISMLDKAQEFRHERYGADWL